MVNLRYSPKQLNRKRGRKKVNKPSENASAELALFCKNDDFLMNPAYLKNKRNPKKRVLVYVCPRCGNLVNPNFQSAQHGMVVQTADNAIEYQGMHRTIAAQKRRSFKDKKDPLQYFLDDKIPGIHDTAGVKILKREIDFKGKRQLRIKVYE